MQQGAASSVMCSYSYVNGTAACQNPYLLSTVLRQQFGFGGFVTSDWGATHSTAASANAGLDMDMPGSDGYYGSALQSAVSSGAVSHGHAQLGGLRRADRDVRVRPVRQAAGRVAGGDRHQRRRPGRRAAAGRGGHGTAEEQRQRPAARRLSDTSIAVIGADASTSPQTAGGGSAGVNSSGTVTPLQGITAAAPSGVTVSYNDGSSDSSAASAAAAASVAVVFASLDESEGSDLTSIDLGSTDRLADLRGRRRQPEHDRGAEHRLRGHHAVAVVGGRACSRPGTRARRTAPRSPRCCSATPTRPAT